jgi:hypothetical protein
MLAEMLAPMQQRLEELERQLGEPQAWVPSSMQQS